MSHFLVIVIGDKPERQLAPYSELMEVPEYFVKEVSEEEKERMLDFYSREKSTRWKSFEACYRAKGKDWNGGAWHKNADGVWCEYSTSNPRGYYDYYRLGGIYTQDRQLRLLGGSSGVIGESDSSRLPGRFSAAKKKDIDFERSADEIFKPAAIVMNGQWIAGCKVGWFGSFKPFMPPEAWARMRRKILLDVPDDDMLWFYDCHI